MLVIVIAFVSLYMYVLANVHACDCVPQQTEGSFKKDDTVFEGTVLEIQE